MLPFEGRRQDCIDMVAGGDGFYAILHFVSLRSKPRQKKRFDFLDRRTDGQTGISWNSGVKLCFARLDLNFDFPTTLHLRWTSSNEAWIILLVLTTVHART